MISFFFCGHEVDFIKLILLLFFYSKEKSYIPPLFRLAVLFLHISVVMFSVHGPQYGFV